ncbi:MAG: hypothetical protein ACE5IM_15045, partial [Nitrospinota bacterium]
MPFAAEKGGLRTLCTALLASAALLAASPAPSVAHHVKMQSGPFGGMVSALAISPENPQRVYAAVFGGGIFRSDDGGTLWTAKSTRLTDTRAYGVVELPAGGGVLAATATGVFRSDNRGESWERSSAGLPDTSARMFALLSGGRVLVATGAGVFLSRDGGRTWAASSRGLENRDVRWLTVEPDEKRKVFAATFGGLYTSGDGGRTWRANANALPSLRAAAVGPGGRSVIAGSASRGLFASEDGGMTFR